MATPGLSTISSWVDICNRALSRLGTKTISSLTDGSPNQKYCSIFLLDAVSEVLDAFDYHAAVRQLQLARDATAPLYGYDYQYPLPSDFLRIKETETGGDSYTIESGKILTNAESVFVKYIYLPETPIGLSSYIIKAIVAALAVRLAEPLISKDELYQKIYRDYEKSMAMAEEKEANNKEKYSYENEIGFTWYDGLR